MASETFGRSLKVAVQALAAAVLAAGVLTTQAAPCGADFTYGNVGSGVDQYACGPSATTSMEGSLSGGTSKLFASLEEGVLRASAYSLATASSSEGTTVGLGTRINFDSPAVQAGEARVTMTVTGDSGWGDAVYGQVRVLAESGVGLGTFPPRGFTGSPGSFGFIDYVIQSWSIPPAPQSCLNCTFTAGELFDFSITAILPFDIGSTYVDYAVQLMISAHWGSFVDAFGTARFSINLPDGMGYSSALTFIDEPTSVVPAPGTGLLVVASAIPLWMSRRRRR
jgi:hypothetical protein